MKSFITLLLIMGFCGSVSCLTRYYFYVNQRMSWLEAEEYCRLHYGDLSTISSEAENQLLMNNTSCLVSEWCKHGLWIGLHSNNSGKQIWKWSGESYSTFSKWALGEPKPEKTVSCARLNTSSGSWYNDNCSLNFTFYCMKESPKLILVQNNKSWKEALDYCRNRSTDLASLLSTEEMLLAINVSQAAQTPKVWIGLYFVVSTWIWIDGNALEYQAWPPGGAPKCPAKNRCGTFEKSDNIWKPGDCEQKLNFLCIRRWTV